MAKLNALLWISDNVNKTLDRTIDKEVMKKSDCLISLVIKPMIKVFSDRDFSKLSTTIKCYKCQGYRHVAAKYPSTFKIAITDGVPIEAPKPDSTISLKVTHAIKEFTITRPLLFPALLSTPPSLPPLLPISIVVTCFDHQSLSFTAVTIPFSLIACVKY